MKKLNNNKLKEVMEKHNLTRKWVANEMLVNLTTVDRWLQPRTISGKRNPTYRAMSDPMFALFKYTMREAMQINIS